MNICLISREFPPFFGGGIGTYTRAWAGVLASGGHRVVVITVCDDGRERRERAEGAGYEIVRLPLVRGEDWSRPDPAVADDGAAAAFSTFSPVSIFAMGVARVLPALQREFEFDVIEAPDTGALSWFWLNRRRTVEGFYQPAPALVLCVHSPTAWIHRWNRSPARTRQELELLSMERDCARWCDGLVCPTRAVADAAAECWGLEAGSIGVIPHPLGDLEAVAREAARAGAGPRGGMPRVLCAGRLEPRKGVDTLIAGAGLAWEAGAEFELMLAGEDMPDPGGSGRFGVGALAAVSDRWRSRVRMLGKLSPDGLARAQAEADVIAVPSPMDNFPYACVEAMARGKVVLAAAAGGMAEMIRDWESGVLFAPGSPPACAEGLRRVAAFPPARTNEMGRAAARRMLEMCGNEAICAQRVAHYERTAAARRERMMGVRPGLRRAARVLGAIGGDGRAAGPLWYAAADPAIGIDFAHGWVRSGGRVRVRSSPRADMLALDPGALGPLAVSPAAMERLLSAGLASEHDGIASVGSTWAAAAHLAAAGFEGAVVPEVVTEVAADAPGPPASGPRGGTEERSAREELARIKASRGWRWLQRAYRVLRIVKGRRA
jgi:glycosyltransferase involved in cell wall biosynthesis